MEAATSPHISSTASSDRDENYDLYAQNRGLEYTPEEGKKVLRKIDLQLIPLLFVIYMIQYLDKNSINFASVYGLEEGTGLKGQDYSWLGECNTFISPFGHCLNRSRLHLLLWLLDRPVACRTGTAEATGREIPWNHHDR